MRNPFLQRAAPSKDKEIKAHPNPPLKTPTYEYTPSDTLQVILHIPANGFIQLQPPLNPIPGEELPGEYDHILNGDVELFAPPGFEDECYEIIVGVWLSSKLVFKGNVEKSSLFKRSVEFSEKIKLISGSQRFNFSLILPCTLPMHDYHDPHVVAAKAFAEVYTTSPRPPSPQPLIRDEFDGTNGQSATEIIVTKRGGVTEVVYKSDTRLRIVHVTESDAGFSALDTGWNGFVQGLGLYDLRITSDVWSIAAPFHFTIKLPSLDPSTTIFFIRLSIIQSPTIRSVQDLSIPPVEITSKISLCELGERPPAGHAHPGKERVALWRASMNAGKVDKSGGIWQGEYWGRLDTDRFLRPSTLPGITTPIQVKHALCAEIFYSVHGEYADDRVMAPSGPGELRVIKLVKGIVLPSCANVPNILNLPTYEESFVDQGEGLCACRFGKEDVITRLKVYEEGLKLVDEQRAEVGRKKRDGQQGSSRV